MGREGWTPLHVFRNMLAGGEGSVDGKAGRGRAKGKKRTQKSEFSFITSSLSRGVCVGKMFAKKSTSLNL